MQHIDKDFAVVSLDNTAQLAVILTRSHLNDVFLSESEKLKPGTRLSVEVIEASCEETLGLPLVSWELNAPKRQRTTSENQAGSKGHCFGEIVQGKVRTVKPTCILVTLEDGVTGSVHVSEVMDPSQVCQGVFPTSSVKVGSTITARVIGGREASSRRCISHITRRHVLLVHLPGFWHSVDAIFFHHELFCFRFLPFSHPKFTYTIPELTLIPR